MEYLEKSEEITGYRVKIRKREAFNVTGYTIIVPPGPPGRVRQFWKDVGTDGRLEKLTKASSIQPWVLGLGSWDPECEKGGQRYTICIEETEHTDFSRLSEEYRLFTKEIGASDWMCFELVESVYFERFWRDNPYKMMGKLGYQFHTREGDYSVGLHFDAYPPGHDPEKNPVMEFWITVIKP
jgi:hypothetical protein